MVKKLLRKILPKKKKKELIPPEGYIVPETCSIPHTCIIKKSSNLVLGKNIAFNDYVFVNAFGGVEIGDYTAIGPFTMIHSANHNYKDKSKLIQEQGHTKLPIKIGKDVITYSTW